MILAKELLTNSILRWIWTGEVVSETSVRQKKLNRLQANPDTSIVLDFIDTEFNDTSVVITFEEELLQQVQHAVCMTDTKLLEKYTELIKEHIMIYANGHAYNWNPQWVLTSEIFQPPRL